MPGGQSSLRTDPVHVGALVALLAGLPHGTRSRATSRPYTTAGTSRSWRSRSSRRRSSSSGCRRLDGAAPSPRVARRRRTRSVARLRRARGRLQRDEGRRVRPLRVLVRPDAGGASGSSSLLPIPLVDVASVYRGPTKVVVEEEPEVFERIAVSFSAGRGGGCPPGPSGRDLLRTLPRRVRALRPAHARDVDRHDGRALGDAGRDLRVRSERTARAPGYLARVPGAELRPAVAGAPGTRTPGRGS